MGHGPVTCLILCSHYVTTRIGVCFIMNIAYKKIIKAFHKPRTKGSVKTRLVSKLFKNLLDYSKIDLRIIYTNYT